MNSKNIRLEERDFLILNLVHKFKFCLGRHIRKLADFSGVRAADRRLKVLVESGYLKRQKYLYGIPYLYTLSHKGRILLGVNKRADQIHLEQITHDIYVIETIIFYLRHYALTLDEVVSEKELHIQDGFGERKHHPDFIILNQDKKYAVEIELTPKNRVRLEKNIKANYLNYEAQIWITDNQKVRALLESFSSKYPNMQIKNLKEMKKYDRV